MMTVQASKYPSKARSWDICETFQEYPYGWYGNCPGEFFATLASFILHHSFLPLPPIIYPMIIALLTAWEEKSWVNSHGLGQIPYICCSWAGQLSVLVFFNWLHFIYTHCSAAAVFFFSGCSCWFCWYASSWSLGHICNPLYSHWLLCEDIFHVSLLCITIYLSNYVTEFVWLNFIRSIE